MDDIDFVLGVMLKLIIFLLCYKKYYRNFFIILVIFIVFYRLNGLNILKKMLKDKKCKF